jgi:hypothetical protein
MKQWTMRTFWDGTTAIFTNKKGGAMSCFDIDSTELSGIINTQLNELEETRESWLKLKKIREEYINEQTKNTN